MADFDDDRYGKYAERGRVVTLDRPVRAGAYEPSHCRPPRSPFLTQLARQYETRGEAITRRQEARSEAAKLYERPSGPNLPPRHLLWT